MDQQEFVIGSAPVESASEVPKPVSAAPVTELLGDSEERFHQLAESINEVFWICAAQNRQFLYVSPAYEKNLGSQLPEPL